MKIKLIYQYSMIFIRGGGEKNEYVIHIMDFFVFIIKLEQVEWLILQQELKRLPSYSRKADI